MKKISSIGQLKKILNKVEAGADFKLLLNFGLFSRKHISLYDDNRFWVLNFIDGSEQKLTEKQIMDDKYTNIGKAIKCGAFYFEGYD